MMPEGLRDRYSQGLFDNFLRLRLRDSSLGSVCTALDWLAFEDTLGQAAYHSQSFQLLRYQPFLLVAFHLLFASSHVPRIAFPNSQQEVCPAPCPLPLTLCLLPFAPVSVGPGILGGPG